MSNAIEVKGLCKEFTDFKLQDVTFALPAGHIMGFVGKNGAGKTTTIRLMLNMIERKSGSISLLGKDNILDEFAIKQDIGIVFDEIFFVDTWKVSDVERAVRSFYTKWSGKLFAQYARDFDLPLDRRIKDLSRGMKMKLMLAVAMSHEAKLLILDEPTSGLDPVARDELLDILSNYSSDGEKTILFSTHITSDLEKIADYITLIDDGRIFYTGTKDDLLNSFVILKGGPDALTDPLREAIIGLSSTKAGFTGLLPVSQAENLPQGIAKETPSIDDILVYISKGGRKHA